MPGLDTLYERFTPGLEEPCHALGPVLWFLFSGSDILIRQIGQATEIPRSASLEELGLAPLRRHFLGLLDGVPCFAAGLPSGGVTPKGLQTAGLRQLFGAVDESVFWVAARAVQVVTWDRDHNFCGRCGAPTSARPGERARECKACELLVYPRISPAVIVCIERGDEVLLARSHRLPAGVFSVIAGFVEAGETLEQAAAREIQEEVGITVKNLCYFCSQPWPFPNSLMIAFTAEYASGDIRIDPGEIAEAGWFRADAMPQIPGPLSVSRQLLDAFLHKNGRAPNIER